MQEVKKVVVIGPESTGKSTLCKKLAMHYQTLWCEEYAREYLLKNGKNYTYEQLLEIAQGQLLLEDEYLKKVEKELLVAAAVDAASITDGRRQGKTASSPSGPRLLFIDTDMYVMKVWCEFVFDKCHLLVLDKIVERPADLYLLCNTDLPWVKDELREYPDLESREKLYNIYKDHLINQQVPWVDIKGTEEERTRRAIYFIDHYFLPTL